MNNQNNKHQINSIADLKLEIPISMDNRLFNVSFNDLMTKDNQLKIPLNLAFQEINQSVWN